MPLAHDLHQLSPRICLWQAFDPAVKTDLFSTAVLMESGLFLVDPIPLVPSVWEDLTAGQRVAGVVVTNANHLRNADEAAQKARAPIFAAEPVAAQLTSTITKEVRGGDQVAPGVTVISLEGAAESELAVHFVGDGGTIVLGDALINLDPYGFALLPPKYCSNQKQLRRSLRQLLDFSFDRLCFAHGLPLVSGARARLEELLR